MRRFLLLLPLLSGCAFQPSLQSRMAAYTGASAETLVQSLGVPDKQITTGGIQYLAYREHHTEITPSLAFGGFGPFYGGGLYGGGFYGGGFDAVLPPDVTEYSCETTFLLKDDRVVSFSLRGNDCN